MASIHFLLNPAPERPVAIHPEIDSNRTYFGMSMTRNLPPGRHKTPAKYKMPKDAPVFKKGEPQGELRYPPCEDRPEEIAEEHQKLKMHPMGADGKISDFARTIPYKSDKKSFEGRTGRRKLEVFQYTFQYGDKPGEWIMMWDYNIGLVRITHLFKALGYTKTTPAKVLAQNPGLRDICHSITGGAIAAQGYWMPFEAAKALAIQFCYRIRYALTPMFGTDFPDMCLDERHENFGRMILDQSIIEQAARTAHYYHSLESQTLPGDAIVGMESTISTASSNSPAWRAEMPICPPALLDEDRIRSQKWPRRSYTDSIASTRGSSSEPYCMSPSSPVSNCFTPVNAPRSHVSATESFLSREANPRLDVPHPATLSPPTSGSRVECNPTAGNYDDSDTDVTSDSVENDSADDEDWREHESRCSTESGIISDADRSKATCSRAVQARARHRPSIPKHFAQEVKAAHALIHLHMQEATADDEDDGALIPDGSSSDVVRRLIRTPDQSHGGRKRRRASV